MQKHPSPNRHVIGVMTGTSIDAMDAALIRVEGVGNAMRVTFLEHHSAPLWPLTDPLRAAAQQQPMTAGQFAQLGWDFGVLHADVIEPLASRTMPDVIAVHGQTIFHQPPYSWQLVNPAPIAARFNCPVVYDLRQADLAIGGQGAPITPAADWVLYRDNSHSRAIVNLGGFCNVSFVPAGGDENAHERVHGFDVCACNQVLDAVARIAMNTPYDDGGKVAASGTAHGAITARLSVILQRQRKAGRSLGTGDEAQQWVADHASTLNAADLAASAVAAIAGCIGEALSEHNVEQVIIAGGGVHNATLVKQLHATVRQPIRTSDELGIPADAREAVAIAVLGARAEGHATFTPLPNQPQCS